MALDDPGIQVCGETLFLQHEHALFWPRRSTLFVADVHLGKAASFRAASIPLPAGTTTQTLDRLTTALTRTGADRLVILGDLLHAQSGRVPHMLEAVSTWRATWAQLDVLLVRGNHDRWAGDPPQDWRLNCVNEPFEDPPFVYRHRPLPAESGYTLAGHLHPAVTLKGKGRQSLRLPCFHFTASVATLPAFGEFTGTAIVRPRITDRVFVVAQATVVEVSAAL